MLAKPHKKIGRLKSCKKLFSSTQPTFKITKVSVTEVSVWETAEVSYNKMEHAGYVNFTWIIYQELCADITGFWFCNLLPYY